MSASSQPETFQGRGNFRKNRFRWENFGVFSRRCFWNYILNEKFNPNHEQKQGLFSKLGHFFPIYKKNRGGLPDSP